MEILLVKISTDAQRCECTSCHGTEHLRVVKNGKFPVMFILPQYKSALLKKKTRSTLTSTLLNRIVRLTDLSEQWSHPGDSLLRLLWDFILLGFLLSF